MAIFGLCEPVMKLAVVGKKDFVTSKDLSCRLGATIPRAK